MDNPNNGLSNFPVIFVNLGHVYAIPEINANNSQLHLGDLAVRLQPQSPAVPWTRAELIDELPRHFIHKQKFRNDQLSIFSRREPCDIASYINKVLEQVDLLPNQLLMANTEEGIELDPVNQTFHSQDTPSDRIYPSRHLPYSNCSYQVGSIFRVWEEGNNYLHTKTFVLFQDYSDKGNCLPIRVYHQDSPELQHGDFLDFHFHLSKLSPNGPAGQASTALIKVHDGILLSADTWINTQEKVFLTYAGTRIAKCGMLVPESVNALRKKLQEELQE